jgi:twitching motility protein PilT
VDARDLDGMLARLDSAGGSDLHLKAGQPARARVNGELQTLPGCPVLTALDTAAVAEGIIRPHVAEDFARLRQADFAYLSAAGARFRAHVYQQRGSTALVLRRVLDEPLSLDELGLPEVAKRLAEHERGLVLVCGPTGSGKTSTLAAMVDHVNRRRRVHVVTIEDPIEIVHRDHLASVSQREIGVDVPDFAAGIRASLREDPDVIVIGELRDRETVAAAMSAAETGHLVLASLHTTDAAETVHRVVELFPDSQRRHARLVLAATLAGTVCQRLVQTADGSGRVPAVEVMVVNGRVQQCIIEPNTKAEITEIIADGEWYGMQTFDRALCSLFEREVIDLTAALAAASNPHDLGVELRRRGLVGSARASRSVT